MTEETQEKHAEMTENQAETQAEETAAADTPSPEALEIQALKAELETRAREVSEVKDLYLRLLADFDNFRKRTQKERAELTLMAAEEVMTSLLPSLDNFDRTLTVMEKTDNLASIKEGLNLVAQSFRKTLEQKGLSRIETVGQPFDSNLHEALANIPAPSDDMVGKVIDEVEKGYKLHDKVIRYAKVIVGE